MGWTSTYLNFFVYEKKHTLLPDMLNKVLMGKKRGSEVCRGSYDRNTAKKISKILNRYQKDVLNTDPGKNCYFLG